MDLDGTFDMALFCLACKLRPPTNIKAKYGFAEYLPDDRTTALCVPVGHDPEPLLTSCTCTRQLVGRHRSTKKDPLRVS